MAGGLAPRPPTASPLGGQAHGGYSCETPTNPGPPGRTEKTLLGIVVVLVLTPLVYVGAWILMPKDAIVAPVAASSA